MREALREALTNSEVSPDADISFLAQIPTMPEEEDDEHCHQASRHSSRITFSLKDMQIKGKHYRPMYYTRYIGSSEVSRIQVDTGSALSIMPCRVMQHLRIPTHRLSATQTTIYDFNANGTRQMGKIKLRCQIGDLKSEVTCYVIDADTFYNLLLGRLLIHSNSIIPSTLHQVMKYADERGRVRTLIAEKYPFKGVENYFTDFHLYQDPLEPADYSTSEDHDYGNVADTESKSGEECL